MALPVPLRVKFLILLLLGVLIVTVTTLVIVRGTVERQIRQEIVSDLRNSVLTFRTFEREREATYSHSAELLADLPTLRAMMTTEDVLTIQDASEGPWRLSGSDLLALADATGKVVAIHTSAKGITRTEAGNAFAQSMRAPEGRQWWLLGGHLYEVLLRPIYFGRSNENRLLGFVALGYEINERAAKQVSQIAGSQVTFLYEQSVVASTLDASRLQNFVHELDAAPVTAVPVKDELVVQDITLGQERFLACTVELESSAGPRVHLNVLKSYDEAGARFRGLYRRLAVLGILACLGQGILAFVAFRRYTRPLERLVAGVRALGRGDFAYPLDSRGRDELAEVTESFIRMRDDLQQTQKQLLETERLATIGRMASSISHDLRHQLTPIVANAEFLSERNLSPQQSEEVYGEIRNAVGRMTELIDSLLEFGNVRPRLSPTYSSIKDTMQRAIGFVQTHPGVHGVKITLAAEGDGAGWFDSKRLERAFYNLLLNACQAAPPDGGLVEVTIAERGESVEIVIRDNGKGIPESIRARIFEPFASFGKENGTGLGLTIVEKLLSEQRGRVELVDATPGRTTFKVVLPLDRESETEGHDHESPAVPENYISSKQGL